MLRSLSIRDFVIVERLDLEFAPGFTVLTGETGAGKSILVDALALVLGERADAIVVRAGSERAEISAEFSVGSGLARWLKDADLSGDEDTLLLRRVIDAGVGVNRIARGDNAITETMNATTVWAVASRRRADEASAHSRW